MRPANRAARVARAITAGLLGYIVLSPLLGAQGAEAAASKQQLAQARHALLVLSDLPSGWKASKSSNDNTPIPGASQLAQCLGIPLSVVDDNPPSVSSPEFDSRDRTESVDDMVEVFPSAKAARADFESIAGSKATRCMSANFNGPARSELTKDFGPEATLGSITVTRTPSSDYAPHSLNFTLFFPVTTNGETLNFEITQVGYLKGAEEQDLTLFSAQPPFPASLSQRVTKAAAGRL